VQQFNQSKLKNWLRLFGSIQAST